MTSKRWAYEDLTEGRVFDLGSRTVTREEILEFAGEFDTQPMHLDEEAGLKSLLGGLSASGWHTCSVFMRMMCDAFLLDSTTEGSPGIAELRWRKPVLAGDTLGGTSTVVSRRRLKSRPEMGLVTFRHLIRNQRNEAVLESENPILFRLRDPGAAE